MKKIRVLYLCTHNAARSQMAEALHQTLLGNSYEVYSAGVQPTVVDEDAITVMKEIGIDISTQRSKHIDEFRNMVFDIIVTVCDHAKQTCPFFPGKQLIHHAVYDPSSITEFRIVRDELTQWIVHTFKR